MHRSLHAAGIVLLGLVTAQVVATIHVSLSNADLLRTLTLIRDAGYLPVPGAGIMDQLQGFKPAFFGGLFFTLSAGAGISLLPLAAAWCWDRLLHRKRPYLMLWLILWAGALVIVNLRGLCPVASLYYLLVPPVVFVSALKWLPGPVQQRGRLDRTGAFLPLLLLAVLWTSQVDGRFFSDFRDHLLLATPSGTKINDFYYRYTLHPAEVFKSLDQKLLKTAEIEGIPQEPVVRALKRTLLNYDYCPVGGGEAVDLKIEQRGTDLILGHGGRAAMRTTLQAFLSRPASVLRDFSQKADRYAFFRHFTFYSLLVGLPLTLYLFLLALLCLLSNLFLRPRTAILLASVLCLLIGVAFLVLFQQNRPVTVGKSGLQEALGSPDWHRRVAALRAAEQERLEVSQFKSYRDLLTSPLVPERYWLARALGVSRRTETYQDLLALLDDPHPNVVSMAFYALGERGDQGAIKVIIERIKTQNDWYSQWYAYKALRKLGWKQSASNPKS